MTKEKKRSDATKGQDWQDKKSCTANKFVGQMSKLDRRAFYVGRSNLQDNVIKGGHCTDGHKQRLSKDREDMASS